VILCLVFLLSACKEDTKPASDADAIADATGDEADRVPDGRSDGNLDDLADPDAAIDVDAMDRGGPCDGCAPPDASSEVDATEMPDGYADQAGEMVDVPLQELPPEDLQSETLCEPGGAFCEDVVTVAICDDGGMAFTTEACPEGKFCLEGECISQICTPGEPVCSGSLATECDEFGSGPAPGGEDCSESGKYCVDGECIACYPDCFGKMCGDDGCGGSCGDCNDGNVCTDDACDDSLFTCSHAPVEDCCLADEECEDNDPCTIPSCVDNACAYEYLCCETHDDCDDEDGLCTQDICINSFCWHKPIPSAECCPKYLLSQNFEFSNAWNWSLSKDGKKLWSVSDEAAHGGVYSLKCEKAHAGAVATLPAVTLSANGGAVEFWYKTKGWAAVDCDSQGVLVYVNGSLAGAACESSAEWTQHLVDLSSWAGKKIVVKLKYNVPAATNPLSKVYLDDLFVIQPCCKQDWDCDDGDPCTKDSCLGDGMCEQKQMPGCCKPGMLQADFEFGTAPGWILSEDGKKKWAVSSADVHTGKYSLAGTEANNGAVATVPSGFVIPHSGGLLKFWHKTVNWNVITWGVDGITIYVNGQEVEVISVPAPEWTTYEFDLSGWAGKPVTIQLKYSIMAAGNIGHKVFIDDLQVVQNCCSDDGQCDDGNECTDDTCGTWGACLHDPDPSCCSPLEFEEDFDTGVAWGWQLSAGLNLEWKLSAEDAHSGTHAIYADGYENGAVAELPINPYIPWSGAKLRFYYRTKNWNNIDCAQDGIVVYANGARVDVVCEPASDWTQAEADLRFWGGQEVELQIVYKIMSSGNTYHSVFIDDVQYVVECCGQDSDCDDGNPCTTDVCTGEACSSVLDTGCCNPELSLEDFELGAAWQWKLSQNDIKKWVLTTEDAYESLVSLACAELHNGAVATLPPQPAAPFSGASLQFRYKTVNWLLLTCENDGVAVLVNGAEAATACVPAEDWTLFSADLTPWAGQEVTVQLVYYLSAGNLGHKVFVDDIAFVQECCTVAADCDDGDPCTEEGCSPGGACSYGEDAGCCSPAVYAEGFEFGTAWGWSLSADGKHKWAVTALDAAGGAYSLTASKASPTAIATLPPIPALPYSGGVLDFFYKTVDWNVVNCDWMGISVFVNGKKAALVCEPAPEWVQYSVDLFPWAGEELQVKLKYHVGDGGNPYHAAYIDDLEVTANCP